MRQNWFVVFISCLIVLLSCKNEHFCTTNRIVVNRHHIYNQDSIVRSDSVMFERAIVEDSICYNYKYPNDNDGYFYQVKIGKINADSVRIYNVSCPLVDNKVISVGNKEYEVLKYEYDKKRVSDEETYYFFCVKYGLLIVDNYTDVGLAYSFDYDSVSRILVKYMLERKGEFGITDNSEMPPNPLLQQ